MSCSRKITLCPPTDEDCPICKSGSTSGVAYPDGRPSEWTCRKCGYKWVIL